MAAATTTAPALSATVSSPIGDLIVTGTAEHVTAITFVGDYSGSETKDWKPIAKAAAAAANGDSKATSKPTAVQQACDELNEYFAGERRDFTVPVAPPRGTDFQRSVWSYLSSHALPFAATTTYAAIAVAMGKASAYRAVGAANGRNAVAVVVPCHRVVGAGGQLTGYAGGVNRKAWLLAHEKKIGAAKP